MWRSPGLRRPSPLILADEPTGNLDSANGKHVLDMLVELNRSEGATLVLVTHNRELAARADRLVTLHGRPHCLR